VSFEGKPQMKSGCPTLEPREKHWGAPIGKPGPGRMAQKGKAHSAPELKGDLKEKEETQ